MPLRYAIERSISPSSRTKTTPKASIVVPAICVMMLLRLDRGEEVLRRQAEDDDDDRQADHHRRAAEVAALDVLPEPRAEALERRLDARRDASSRSSRGRSGSVGDARHLRRLARGDRVHDLLLRRLRRSKRPALRPSRSTKILSPTAKTSCRLCEMRMTASPCWASRSTSSRTCSVCATPSAAVGSSRMTSFEFHITARATATDWRCPPESVATACRTERIVVTRSVFSVSAVRCSITGSLSRWNASCASRPRNMFCTTSRLSHSARSW